MPITTTVDFCNHIHYYDSFSLSFCVSRLFQSNYGITISNVQFLETKLLIPCLEMLESSIHKWFVMILHSIWRHDQ